MQKVPVGAIWMHIRGIFIEDQHKSPILPTGTFRQRGTPAAFPKRCSTFWSGATNIYMYMYVCIYIYIFIYIYIYCIHVTSSAYWYECWHDPLQNGEHPTFDRGTHEFDIPGCGFSVAELRPIFQLPGPAWLATNAPAFSWVLKYRCLSCLCKLLQRSFKDMRVAIW